jgi:hypothetical protein
MAISHPAPAMADTGHRPPASQRKSFYALFQKALLNLTL